MIRKEDVIHFFDQRAAKWDEDLQHNDEIINAILDNATVTKGKHILDVACGTGVLFKDYIDREVSSVLAIDISEKMCTEASRKYPGSCIRVMCGDVEELKTDELFDVIVIYNAFPHFPDPEKLIEHCASLVKKGGRLTIAHGLSRAQIDAHHHGAASGVSNGLMHENELKKLFDPYFDVDVLISDERMYQVAGVKR